MTRKRAVVLVLAALMAATTIFPASAYASIEDFEEVNYPL